MPCIPSSKSTCTMQDRPALGMVILPKSWMQFMSCALNTFGHCLVIMQSDLVGYLRGRFWYYLVSCTLSGTQSWVLKWGWDLTNDTCPHGITGSTWGKRVLKERGNKKTWSKTQWEKRDLGRVVVTGLYLWSLWYTGWQCVPEELA